MALWAQGLVGKQPGGGVPGLLRRLGTVQLDTISVLARTHELVPFSRLGPIGKQKIHDAYWGHPPRAFEYWGHLASIIPIEMWPWFAARRRRRLALVSRWGVSAKQMAEVRAALRDDGPMTTNGFGGARAKGAGWWEWSPAKTAFEALLSTGEVTCVERQGWRRVYELADRVVPAQLLAQQRSDLECHARLTAMAGERLGIATLADLANFWWMPQRDARAGLQGSGLVAVTVEGWDKAAWAHPAALAGLATGVGRGRHRTTLLSPFDSLIWFRQRTLRIFDFHLRLEAYVPAPKRIHGYFVMPILAGGRLVGRVDPKREGTTLRVKQLSAEPRQAAAVALALVRAAAWVDCDSVVLERVEPAVLRSGVAAELRRLGAA